MMTREERLKAVQEMDAVIERAEHACQSYELIQMEMIFQAGLDRALKDLAEPLFTPTLANPRQA
jgi:uncharacterized protein Yka (UPF0111/DUF47 family)